MSYNVGLNIIETDGRATPSIQAAQTSVTAFLILSERGVPGEVRQVVNWSQFKEYFGSYKAGANGAYALQGFFDNGGTMAYVTRLVTTAGGINEAAYASVTGRPATPLVLPEKELKILVDGVGKTVAFSPKTPAQLAGSLSDQLPEGLSLELALEVNGLPAVSYTFKEQDFPGGGEILEDLATVLNREFTGINAYTEQENGETKILIQTNFSGAGASLKAAGNLAEYLDFPNDAVWGTGNITKMSEADLNEVAEVIGALETAGLQVELSPDGKQLTLRNAKPGENHTLQVEDSEAGRALGFDFVQQAGEKVVEAVAARAQLGSGLKVTAGYKGKEDPGAWGNNLAVEITANSEAKDRYDLTVYLNQSLVETWEALVDPAQAAALLNNPSSGSKYIMLTPLLSGGLALANKTVLTQGGDDDLGPDKVKSRVRETKEYFDTYDVQLVCCPESSEPEVVSELITYCENRGDCMFAGHTPAEASVNAAKEYGKKFRGSKVYGALYFPWIRVFDPLDPSGAKVKFIPPTGHILGVYGRTERERGIWKAPAGNAARLNGALDVQLSITDVEHTDLVKNANVNAVRFISGQGIVIDSSRTLSTSTLWLYVNVRLLFNFVKSSLKAGLRWVVQEPNNEALWNKIKYNSVTPFLMGLWRQGAFGPGKPEQVFTVKVDGENNPPANIQQGILTVEVYFYPSRPAETIIITVGQQEGGATAGDN